MNLFVLAWNLAEDLSATILGELQRMTDTYPELDPDSLWTFGDGRRIFAASIHTPLSALGTRRYVWIDENSATFYDGTAVDSLGDRPVYDAKFLASAWNELPGFLDGQYSLARVGDSPPAVTLMSDFLGMRDTFYCRAEQGYVVSNSAMLLSKILGTRAFDPLGVSTCLTWGWPSGDRSLLRDVSVVPPAQIWEWRSPDPAPHRRDYSPRGRLAQLTRSSPTQATVSAATTTLTRMVGNLNRHLGDLSCALTGGRDTRLIASMLHHAGVPVPYVTFAPRDSAEARIASRVAGVLAVQHVIESSPAGSVADQWDDLAPKLVSQNDGMVSLWQIQTLLNRSTCVDHLPLRLHCHAGELLRATYTEPRHLVGNPSSKGITRSLIHKLVDDHGGLLREDTLQQSRSYLHQFVKDQIEMGFQANEVPDVFQAFERTGRWAGTIIRPSLPVTENFQPFCTRHAAELAFSMNLPDRYFEKFNRGAIRLLAPQLVGVPFGKLSHRYARLVKDVAGLLARVTGVGGLRTTGYQGSPQAAWIEAVRPRLREICLDQSDSDLWTYVDRACFEQITSHSADPLERARRAEGLLQVSTLFYYALV